MVHAGFCNCQYDDQTGGWDYDPRCEQLSDAQELSEVYEPKVEAIIGSLPDKFWLERVDHDAFRLGIGDGFIEVKDADLERPRLTAGGFTNVQMSGFDAAVLCLYAARQLASSIIANQYRPEPVGAF